MYNRNGCKLLLQMILKEVLCTKVSFEELITSIANFMFWLFCGATCEVYMNVHKEIVEYLSLVLL